MIPEKNASRPFWLTLLVFTFALSLYAAIATYSRSTEAGIILQRSVWGGMLLVYSGTALLCIWLFLRVARGSPFPARSFSWFERLRLDGTLWRILGWILFLVILFLIPSVKFSYQIGQTVKRPVHSFDPIMLLILYYWVCWWLVLVAMAALKVALRASWQTGFASATVLLGVAYEVLIRLNLVTTYPLSMGWSEGSR